MLPARLKLRMKVLLREGRDMDERCRLPAKSPSQGSRAAKQAERPPDFRPTDLGEDSNCSIPA